MTVGYYDNDLAASVTQHGVTTTYSLDALQRRATASTTSSSGTTTLVRHYADQSDSPSWAVATDTTGNVSTSWYGSSLGGDLGITLTDGVAQVQLSDIHGDVALPVTVSADGTVTDVGGYSDFDEYGNPVTITTDPDTGVIAYGWLGAKERATDTTGLLLMGVRLYNPVTGSFTSVDPVPGGNATAYTYPQDPINKYDTSGKNWWSKIKKGLRATGAWLDRNAGTIGLVLSVVGMFTCSICAGIALAGLIVGAYSAARTCAGNLRSIDCGLGVASTVAGGSGMLFGKIGRGLMSAGRARIAANGGRSVVPHIYHSVVGRATVQVGRAARHGGNALGWSSNAMSAGSAWHSRRG
ncbi:RHS repeat-associated core domain-containing protein [Demequina capsici]|uniref:RHS repeat-associated core domain-containing protein n=1 Tax=Demequina capsici TaxID=3075620 RepID=A0AA96FH04_9MICO|nr:RHS repeat-associated core domain-containing protein [Demequina sp. PMTSA13]WNM28370.1 RHS repeat-associated core domain-containing protein [Demequina sp. PMTSA13]